MDRDEIICQCMNVSAGAIMDAVKAGADTLEKVQQETGAGTVCGSCLESIQDLMDQLS